MQPLEGNRFFVGVDVGTGSARAGVFDVAGKLLGTASQAIAMRNPRSGQFEQSSEDIWHACCTVVKKALALSSAPAEQVAGIAFDATCSLVVLGAEARPLAVGADLPDDPELGHCTSGLTYDIIVWCDHRAVKEADAINATGHRLLKCVGGKVSPEMEMPKLAWLKSHKPKTFSAAKSFFDLADYLTHRANDGIGKAVPRSLCTVVCKWNFDASSRSWDREFLASIGLEDLGEERIGSPSDVKDVGSLVPGGLGAKAAEQLGLVAGTALAVGAIDAHAGGLGCLGADAESPLPLPPTEARLALIAGTSACHMASSEEALEVAGVWGPYDSAMVPGLFLNEGGQSAAGAALDFLVETHAAYPALKEKAAAAGQKPAELLNVRISKLAEEQNLQFPALLTSGIFVGPDFSGNRSPLADSSPRGSILGLGPAGSVEDASSIDALAVLYLAGTQALAYSSRSIVEALNQVRRLQASTPDIAAIHACGGLAANDLYLQTHADVLGVPVHRAEEVGGAVLLGSAMLAATAAGAFSSVASAMRGMGRLGASVLPSQDPTLKRFHDARYEIFLRMQRHQQEYQALEQSALEGCKRRRL
eukprot:TRINITY_DN47128_c0_g1_i1.p1 TRINITY_DN47128_c0_g1~~TRINITY_DN47128_c0_g1_i1.p1  ORF type:complete len:590 (-),score=117.34 TRINITY_DN47128_c0_g1_i1:15-1784(-)